ncbi:MAG: hydrogenase 3 maturation endopeptidase HyCI [Candidatus Bathyarchaeota archaeon]|nr:hydrogenase 3 maturation endopeptidase HyCI [Candidatus Bathyarchaeota archaeon]MDH5746772.1 hydrogenase 3 maturation endopeptidase HyCI [Candidatus Bathyarchaeota archaeon]
MISGNCNVEKELKAWFSNAGKAVAAGVGNPIRMDDFVGTKIVQDLQGKVSEKVYLIECETVPENFIQKIIDFNPTHILLIDAAVLGLKPGDSRLIKPELLAAFPAYSTHALPLRIFCEYLAKTTRAKIALLLIEPEKADFGEGLTSKVEASAQKIVEILLRVLP